MKFTFTVSGMTEQQAQALLDMIVKFVNALGLKMRGGFRDQEKK